MTHQLNKVMQRVTTRTVAHQIWLWVLSSSKVVYLAALSHLVLIEREQKHLHALSPALFLSLSPLSLFWVT